LQIVNRSALGCKNGCVLRNSSFDFALVIANEAQPAAGALY